MSWRLAPNRGPESVKTWDSDDAGDPRQAVRHAANSVLVLTSESEIAVNHAFPRNGDYLIHVHASGDQAGPEPVRMAVRIDGKELKRFDVTASAGKSQDFSGSAETARWPTAAVGRILERLLQPVRPRSQAPRSELDRRDDRGRGATHAAGDPCPSRGGGS